MAMAAAGSTHRPAVAGWNRSVAAASMAPRFVSHSRGAARAGHPAGGCTSPSRGCAQAGRPRVQVTLCNRNATLAAAPPANRISSTADATSGGTLPACAGKALK